MEFSFTEEQEMFRTQVRRFVQKELAPWERERAKQEKYSRELIKRLAEVGIMGLIIPPEYGGGGGDFVSLGIAVEELGRSGISDGHLLASYNFFYFLLKNGSEEQRRKYLPLMCKGECVCCPCMTEPHCGSDAAAIRTTAAREGNHYILNGEKAPVTVGMIADVAGIFVKTDPKAGAKGITCFVVPLDLPGVSRSPLNYTGWKPLAEASIFFDNVRISEEHRIGEEGKGFYIVMSSFDFARICVALSALGSAQASLEDAIAYAKERVAFGRPIAKFEAVAFKIAEHVTRVEAARLLCYKALWLGDQGLPYVKESAMSKWFGVVVAVNAIHDALLIHGHVGYSEEHSLEQRLRDAIGCEFGDGTAEAMKTIICREVLGREFLPLT